MAVAGDWRAEDKEKNDRRVIGRAPSKECQKSWTNEDDGDERKGWIFRW